MNTLKLIKQQGNQIENLYGMIDDVITMFNDIQQENMKLTKELIDNNNENVVIINKRLNQMDNDIILNDEEQSKKKHILTEEIDKQLKEERKKNGLYKTDITKKLSKLKRENNEEIYNNIKILKVNMEKNNKNKELIEKMGEIQEELKIIQSTSLDYQSNNNKTIASLRREIRMIRNAKKSEVKGINVI